MSFLHMTNKEQVVTLKLHITIVLIASWSLTSLVFYRKVRSRKFKYYAQDHTPSFSSGLELKFRFSDQNCEFFLPVRMPTK
jgi:hypothetical protein